MHKDGRKILSDEELAVLAANGDDKSMARLISAVSPIARAKASKFAKAGIPDEDLVQEGMLGFLDAVSSFDRSRGVPFRAYAEICINNRIVSAVRANFNNKNAALSSALPFEDETADSSADPANIFSAKCESENIRAFLDSCLSDFERQVIDLRLMSKTYSLIAASLGCNEKAVDNAMQRIRKKLRKFCG